MVESVLGIDCPVCGRDLTVWSIEIRTQHVEACLTRPQPETKKRKVAAGAPKLGAKPFSNEKDKYINSTVMKSETKSVKVIKPPTNLGVSRAKKPIPTVKILSFPTQSLSMYDIAVDAFCYSPHDTISQYFLTHFHSDHYGGITKKWSYERVFKQDTDFENDAKYKKIIYCTVITARLLTLRFSVDPRFIKALELNQRYCIKRFDTCPEQATIIDKEGAYESVDNHPGLYVTPITANHCPGSAIFLFESFGIDGTIRRTLHCGDFRVNKDILCHPSLLPFSVNSKSEDALLLDKVYLDTTYMSPSYNFPKQELVCHTIADLFEALTTEEQSEDSLFSKWFGILKQSRITDFFSNRIARKKKKFLILVGTYLIGKERLAISILKRLGCPIYILNINSRSDKLEILQTYDDEYLNKTIVDNDLGSEDSECVIHLVPMNIVNAVGELSNYFNHNRYFEVFERCVGLRPTGWTFLGRGNEQETEQSTIDDSTIQFSQLHNILKHCPKYDYMEDILPQSPVLKKVPNKKGRPDECLYRIYSVPYSEHSSYRELAYFTIFFNIGKVIPTVNIGNEWSIKKMDDIIRRWEIARDIRLKRMSKLEEVDFQLVEAFDKLSLDNF
ncbi:uncharacterized protein CANTADRAFT_56582 [Suhomyces tanzawaensis NRRL Y-17324]|uniref:DNA repair metallo-beta-lactamase domain-containing protein n=1 Tax=Suhomyces tanzawaensis NRRL Y-17324 TaxID=984487 RepID=A0A1E4SD28_9ASCO|nr:uncharacterized protein CANTADRAFT_56582 [Suhomyces tanzawaensis NRRL Y-17324]ODV77421.1 hypothetical protein CANTADRAFT_56582 [Suhomyces tanzawaensis NRRL Y-17324]